ncbi:MAG: hypothetical protein HOU81_00130 [Hamadaea sp.]|uniref:hypothetical protein n=1 Tax=Hamadaea sp. TaxID=2024425 RepID=UPI0017A7E9DC|nr:hypothetical protein [Hamadaea sp.]NUR69224.1 hypothetical protein [Hamadaea sp.]NUT22300.1 hypothetical protein [Hamadaea sp.]
MDQQKHSVVTVQDQAKWVALLAVVVGIVGWIIVGNTLSDVQYGARNAGYLFVASLAVAILATVAAGTSMVVAWVLSPLVRNDD